MKLKMQIKRDVAALLALLMTLSVMSLQAFAAKTNTVLEGKVTVEDSLGNGTLSSGTVSITAAGGLTGIKRKTNTIKIYNKSEKKSSHFCVLLVISL